MSASGRQKGRGTDSDFWPPPTLFKRNKVGPSGHVRGNHQKLLYVQLFGELQSFLLVPTLSVRIHELISMDFTMIHVTQKIPRDRKCHPFPLPPTPLEGAWVLMSGPSPILLVCAPVEPRWAWVQMEMLWRYLGSTNPIIERKEKKRKKKPNNG